MMDGAVGTPESQGPVGIGGWLILPVLGFAATILLTGVNLWQVLEAFDGSRAILTAPSSSPLAALKIPFAASLVFGILVVASAALCLILVFSKNRAIVKVAIAHYLILMIGGLLDVWVDHETHRAIPDVPLDPTIIRDAVRGVLIACIWIPYFLMSKRVRNTFVDKQPAIVERAGADPVDTSR